MTSKVKEHEERICSLTAKIEETHPMKQQGGVWSWEACGVHGTDVCAICGLTHNWGRGGQNTGSYDHWESASGERLTLAQAAALTCE